MVVSPVSEMVFLWNPHSLPIPEYQNLSNFFVEKGTCTKITPSTEHLTEGLTVKRGLIDWNPDLNCVKVPYHRLNIEVDLQSLFGLHVT
jgi:hypothetical protein